MRLRGPATVPRPEYQWPTKLLVRPKSQDAEVRMVHLQERPEVVEVFLAARRAPTPKPEANALGVKDLAEVPMATLAEETGDVVTRGAPRGGLIEHSESEWSSPIVIVLKKNGEDIRICVDYMLVNQLIKISRYPLPLIDDLLTDFKTAAWFRRLDMASGFWAIQMTKRAKLISAFVCPFGHFQWIRMPFGLKNAPLVYQMGFVRLPPEEEAKVDRDVLEILKLPVPDTGPTIENPRHEGSTRLLELTKEASAFRRNIPTPTQMGPVVRRSSYIDDIAHGAPTWNQLYEDLNALLFRLRYWNILVSLPKSEFGKHMPYLSHEVCAEDIRATLKIARSVQDLPFPSTLKGVQSFLGSLNYYNKFIEDLPVVAAVLRGPRSSRPDLDRANEAFKILKRKITSTPLLRHPDCTKPFVIIPHANPWAACAVLGQEYGGVIQPFRFTGRVLSESELRYHIAEKDVLVIQRVLDQFRPLIYSSEIPIVIYTRYSVLKRLLKSNSADGRHLKWGLELSKWTLELRRVQRDEDGLADILGAGITPRGHLDEVAENLIPAKGRIKAPPPISVEMLNSDIEGYVLSFDDAAKVSTRQGKYHGLIKGLELAVDRGFRDVVVVGDSRIVILQAQG
ncbi:reverse transcriptase [Phytophthora megakarya]|uniref:Reverse transcriptase n=1 Tax=Phytophthora megakarya TaxID=4795 RepID=A0A225WS52_9STRA|nr:reverse transcriptase [Phytophthora megakarya]